jgi:hypothetical protein
VRFGAGVRKEEFFFEKKNQKTFEYSRALPASPRQPRKSFLVLFYKKELLA